MNEREPRSENNPDQEGCVQRYEAMMNSNTRLFFDVEEFEMIMDHYMEESDVKRAKQVLDYAREQHPTSIDLKYCEAEVYMAMGKLHKALTVLDGLEKLEPLSQDIQLQKASIHSQLRNHRRAVQHYQKALDLAEEGIDEILLDLAFEYENLDMPEEAIECLQRALKINPENDGVLYELAYVYDMSDAHQASVAYFRSFTDEHPYAFVAWFSLGNALARLERLDESNDALDLCMAIEDTFSSAYFSKARNLLVQGHYEDAVACYEETIKFDGPQAVTFSFIGECYEKMERYDVALVHYDQALALDPMWADAWVGRGVVKDLSGKIKEAIKDLEQATRLAPESGDAWYYYANALGRGERYADSLKAYEKLNSMEPENLDGWMDHADLLLHLKGPEVAARKLREGEMVHKLNGRWRYRLVSYLLRSGHLQQALSELEEALMVDHAGHATLIGHYPEAEHMPQVMHLIALYGK
jgi:tetratricopeptide (TPR) repeat protein